MKEIPLTQGKVALVDDEDFDRVNQFKWFAARRVKKSGVLWYAQRSLYRKGRFPKTIQLHTFLLPGPIMVDHRDGDGLNCQKLNLRPATFSGNSSNSRKRAGCSSQFKGVTWHVSSKKWMAQIVADSKRRHLGYFDSERKAALAYNRAAKALFGEFAKLNSV